MLRKGQWLTAAALAAGLSMAATLPLNAEERAGISWPRKASTLRVAWETLFSWWGAKRIVGGPLCSPGETEGSCGQDPNGSTAAGSPPQCGPGETESSCGQDPNG